MVTHRWRRNNSRTILLDLIAALSLQIQWPSLDCARRGALRRRAFWDRLHQLFGRDGWLHRLPIACQLQVDKTRCHPTLVRFDHGRNCPRTLVVTHLDRLISILFGILILYFFERILSFGSKIILSLVELPVVFFKKCSVDVSNDVTTIFFCITDWAFWKVFRRENVCLRRSY